MTLSGLIEEMVEIPKGVTVTMQGAIVEVKGPKGKLSRDFSNPKTKVRVDGDHIVVSCELPRVKDKAMIGTFASHLTNMIEGVTIRLRVPHEDRLLSLPDEDIGEGGQVHHRELPR